MKGNGTGAMADFADKEQPQIGAPHLASSFVSTKLIEEYSYCSIYQPSSLNDTGHGA
jgi:hypothetical protein